MKRLILGMACISAGVFVAVGCSSNDSNGGTPAVDSGVAVADTAPPAQDSKPPVKPDAKPEVDSGPAEPACYSLPPVNEAGDKATAEQVLGAIRSPAQYGYHSALPRADGCSQGDASTFAAAFDAKNQASGGDVSKFFQLQNDVGAVAGLSTSCAQCIAAEYGASNPQSSTAKWGVSGARFTADRKVSAPTQLLFGQLNLSGCLQVSGVLSAEQAGAVYRAEVCSRLLCRCTSLGDLQECQAFALKDGACQPLAADLQAVTSIAGPALAEGGVCGDASKVVLAFCGNAGGGTATDAGIGQ